jgi:hypothetical protein
MDMKWAFIIAAAIVIPIYLAFIIVQLPTTEEEPTTDEEIRVGNFTKQINCNSRENGFQKIRSCNI